MPRCSLATHLGYCSRICFPKVPYYFLRNHPHNMLQTEAFGLTWMPEKYMHCWKVESREMGRQQGREKASSGAGQQRAEWLVKQHHTCAADSQGRARWHQWESCPGGLAQWLPACLHFQQPSVEADRVCLPCRRHADSMLKGQDLQEFENVGTEQKKGGDKVWHCCDGCWKVMWA